MAARERLNLFTTREAADYFGGAPSEATLNTWRCTKRGGPPYIRIGRLIRYRKEDLDRWLAERTEGMTAAAAHLATA